MSTPNSVSIVGIDFQGAPASFEYLFMIDRSDVYLIDSTITTTQECSGTIIRTVSSNATLNRVDIPHLDGALAVFSFGGSLTVIDCNWSQMTGYIVAVVNASLAFRNLTVRDSDVGYIAAAGTDSAVAIENCRFYNVTTHRAFAMSPIGRLNILNSSFENIRGTASSPLLAIRAQSDTVISIAHSNFTDIALLTSGAVVDAAIGINTLGREVLIDGCRFSSTLNSANTIGALSFYNVDSPSAPAVEGPTVIRNSYFGGLSAKNGGAIFAQGVRSLTIQGCKFEKNSATEAGGAIRISHSTRTTTTLSALISDTEFVNNEVRSATLFNRFGKPFVASGGAISVDGPLESIVVQRCQFVENKVISTVGWANGGALQIGAFYRVSNVSLIQNSFFNNSAEGWEPATGGAFAINGLFGLNTQSNVFRSNIASLSAPQPFFEPQRRLAFGGGAYIAGFAGRVNENYAVLHGDVFYGNAAGQGGALHLQECGFVLNGSTFTLNYADSTSAGVLFMYSNLYQLIPANLGNLTSSVSFDLNFIGGPVEDPSYTRYSNCSVRGIQSQQAVKISCADCAFSEGYSSFSAPDVAAVGSELFLLASPSNMLPVTVITPENVPFGGISGIDPIPLILPTTSLDGLIVAFPLPATVVDSSIAQGSCENLLTSATFEQPGWDRATSSCTWDSRRQVLTIRASSLPFPGFVQFVYMSLEFSGLDVVTTPQPILPALGATFAARVSIAESLDPCADSLISGAGSFIPGVFPKVYEWNVTITSDEPAVSSFIASRSHSSFLLPDALWSLSTEQRNVSIYLRVSSAGAPYSPASVATSVRPADPLPQIYLEGPTKRKQYAALESQLSARVSIPTCLSLRNVSVIKSWSILSSNAPALLSNPWFGQTYFLPPSSLAPGMEYLFGFTASASAGGYTVSRSINVSVDALFSPVLVYSSGAGGLLSSNQSAELEVTVVDPDLSPTVAEFVWDIACRSAGNKTPPAEPLPTPFFITPYHFPRFYCDCITFAFGKTQNNTLPTSLVPRLYTALVAGSKDSRSFQLDIRANITNSMADSYLRIRLTPRWRRAKPERSERIAVSATVDGVGVLNPSIFRSEWNVFTNGTQDLGYLISADHVTTPLDGTSLGIAFRPETFQSGQMYTLQLSIYDVGTSQLRGRNWIDFEVNSAPSGGSISFSRDSALQFESIGVWFTGWSDEDDPLRYSVSIVLDPADGAEEIVLTDLVDVEKAEVTMTVPGNYTLRARVIDALGSSVYVDQRVSVAASGSTTDVVDDLITLVQIGDLRRASAFLTLLSNSSDVSHRRAVVAALESYVSQTRLTANNAMLVLKILKRLSINQNDTVALRLGSVDLLCDVVEAIFNSTSFGSSAFTLLSSQSNVGLQSLKDFVSIVTQLLSSFQKNIRPLAKTAQASRLVASSLQLAQVLSRVSLLNEIATNVTSTLFEATSFVRCGDEAMMLRFSNMSATISSETYRNCSAGIGIAVDGVSFGGGAFPSPFFYNATNSTQPRVPSVAPVISVGIRSFEISVSSSWNVSVSFNNVSIPSGASYNQSQPPTCVVFDGSAQKWTSSGCMLIPSSIEGGQYTCQCSVPAAQQSSASPSGPAQSLLLSIAFGPFTNEPDDLVASSGTELTPAESELNAEAARLATGAIIGIVVAAVVCAGCIGAVVIYRAFFKAKTDDMDDLEEMNHLKPAEVGKNDHSSSITEYTAIGTSGGSVMGSSLSVATIPTSDIKLLNKLGEGAYGSVWLGVLSDGSFVAVKKLSNGSQSVQVREFFAEASIMAQVNESRHVVRLNGIVAEDGDFGIVMEFCPGGSLESYSHKIASGEAWSGSRLFDLIYGIACGMRDLAALKIVHRDLALRNVLLDEIGLPKISDFGYSRRLDAQSQGKTQASFGPVRWMSPENMDRLYSEKSDVWSFGCCIVELLTGTIPYPHFQGDLADLSLAIRDQGLTPMGDMAAILRSNGVEAPEWCLELLSLCFKPAADDRPAFETIVKLLEDTHPVQYVSFMNKLENKDSILNVGGVEMGDNESICLNAAPSTPKSEITKAKKQSKKAKKLQGTIMLNENMVERSAAKQPRFEGSVTLVCRLGEGSFGTVYLGTIGGRYIAVKQMSVSSGDSSQESPASPLFTEAALMTKLKPHRNIIGVYGISVERQTISLLLEFASRGSLEGFVKKHGDAIPERLLFRFAIGVARGMASLSSQHIVHRDLAARNVLLDSSLEPRMCDFGLSRVVQVVGDVGKTSSDVGPVRWMAPEAFAHAYSEKSDVWSYGALLVEMLSGDAPFGSTLGLADVIVGVRDHGWTPLALTGPQAAQVDLAWLQSAPTYLVELMQLCFKYDPAERPSFDLVLEYLEHHVPENVAKEEAQRQKRREKREKLLKAIDEIALT
eukprot:TRINITY_DN357_c0_g3_i2.p1 TRINITY_DN357_c0_g3~~TRINITY_DN357_c0_g3_i2.p1  ORF type:complete len:2381 (+),score=375.38 TRINITY_DN357_c0_g3_i2:463-7605(+)